MSDIRLKGKRGFVATVISAGDKSYMVNGEFTGGIPIVPEGVSYPRIRCMPPESEPTHRYAVVHTILRAFNNLNWPVPEVRQWSPRRSYLKAGELEFVSYAYEVASQDSQDESIQAVQEVR